MPNLLFICSKNQWCSPTGEMLFKDIDWADMIFAMEHKHKALLKQRFVFPGKEMIVLDIEDNYRFGDIMLIEILTTALTGYL